MFKNVGLALVVLLAASKTAAATDCASFESCSLRNLATGAQTKLTGKDLYTIVPGGRNDYSIVCTVDRSTGESDFIKYKFNGQVQDEFDEPRWLEGDSDQGAYIVPSKYLSTCGTKTILVEGHVWAKICFEKSFVLEARGCGYTPTAPPVKPPTPAPVKPPTPAPVKPPTPAPVKPPTPAPVKPPTKAPVKPPVPVYRPTPVRLPTRRPTLRPTMKPVSVPAPIGCNKPVIKHYPCVLPPGGDSYLLITSGDATVGAHNMYKGMAVCGTLTDGTPSENGTVDRTKTLVGTLAPGANFNFNGGIAKGQCLPASIFEHYAYLATRAVSSNTNGKKVIVMTKGGTFNTYHFNRGGQGEDNGNTVVIFNTCDDIVITKTSDGRQFGPSIIAPFSKVTVLGDAGYVDGLIVAKTFTTSGSNQGQLQLHGDHYTGPFTCV